MSIKLLGQSDKVCVNVAGDNLDVTAVCWNALG